MFSFSKSLKGNRVNLFSGERQFRNNIRERGGDFSVGKRLAHGGIVSRRRSQISSPDSFVDAGRARAIESKGFPVCCSSIGEQSLRRIPIRFQSLGNAFIAFLYFSFPSFLSFRPRNLSRVQTSSLLATPQFPTPIDETTYEEVFGARTERKICHLALHAFFSTPPFSTKFLFSFFFF